MSMKMEVANLKSADIIEDTIPQNKYTKKLVDFIRTTKRGIVVHSANY